LICVRKNCSFKDDYRKTIIGTVISDYSDICLEIEEARSFARENSENKTRGDFYQDGKKHWQKIAMNVQKLDANREELNKQFRVDQRNFWFKFAGVIGVVATLLWRFSRS
jgi:ferric-dicitrate binding protein FerR (iron transport regulator)